MNSRPAPISLGALLIRPVTWLVALWVLAMISLPIVKWTAGYGAIPAVVSLAVLLQTTAVVVILVSSWGARRTALVALAVVALGWSVEALGSKTGIPFGHYDYTQILQPQLLGVPLIVPLAWLMMLPPAWAVGRLLSGAYGTAAFVAVSALAFTAWDLFLDPQMVAWSFWEWENPSGYFGIPWVNYLGWLASSALITLAVRPRDLPLLPLLLVYTITWALETIGLSVFWGLVGPGLAGGLAMGILVLLGWRQLLRSRRAASADGEATGSWLRLS